MLQSIIPNIRGPRESSATPPPRLETLHIEVLVPWDDPMLGTSDVIRELVQECSDPGLPPLRQLIVTERVVY